MYGVSASARVQIRCKGSQSGAVWCWRGALEACSVVGTATSVLE